MNRSAVRKAPYRPISWIWNKAWTLAFDMRLAGRTRCNRCTFSRAQHAGYTVTKHHVMAGRSFGFDKEPGREYHFSVIEGTETKKVEIKG